jgi:transposase-like protein
MRRWFYAIKMFLNSRKGISGCQLERELGVAYSTAWRMLQQIRIAMKNEKIKTLFKGIVEADETYDGGKPKKGNAILDKDGNVIGRTKPKNKRGRGTNKTPIFGMKERETGKVRAKVMEPNEKGQKLTGKQLLASIKENVEEGSTIMTDDFSSYNILDKKRQKEKYKHETVNHSKGQYYAGNGIHTNGIENFWSVYKRGMIGIYHHASREYLQRYVDEFVFRQNTRLDTDMFDILLKQCILD